MRHMWSQLSGGVRVNVIVNGLLDNVNALLTQNSGNLGWRPVLLNYHLIYTPPEFRRFAVVALQTMLQPSLIPFANTISSDFQEYPVSVHVLEQEQQD